MLCMHKGETMSFELPHYSKELIKCDSPMENLLFKTIEEVGIEINTLIHLRSKGINYLFEIIRIPDYESILANHFDWQQSREIQKFLYMYF